jgi:hypothetical protein
MPPLYAAVIGLATMSGMWDSSGGGGLRFLPAAWFPADVLDEIETALAQVCCEVQAAGCGDDVGEPLSFVSCELSRHSGAPDEACLVMKSAVLDMAAALSTAARFASRHGLAAAAFALAGIEGRLLELLVDAQPMASA